MKFEKCIWHTCDEPAAIGGEIRVCSVQCRNKFHTARRRKQLKLRAVEYLGGCCQRCGYDRSVAAMDFHHRDPAQKDFAISAAGSSMSWARMRAELDKCDLLCANCHREHHDSGRTDYLMLGRPVDMDGSGLSPRSCVCDGCGGEKSKAAAECATCAGLRRQRIEWPDVDQLASMVASSSYSAVGRKLGVSDNAVRKRIKSRRSAS